MDYPTNWSQDRVAKTSDIRLEEEMQDAYIAARELLEEAQYLEGYADDYDMSAMQDKVEPMPDKEFQDYCFERARLHRVKAHEVRKELVLMNRWANYLSAVLDIRDALASKPWADWDELCDELGFTQAERRELAWCFVV